MHFTFRTRRPSDTPNNDGKGDGGGGRWTDNAVEMPEEYIKVLLCKSAWHEIEKPNCLVGIKIDSTSTLIRIREREREKTVEDTPLSVFLFRALPPSNGIKMIFLEPSIWPGN